MKQTVHNDFADGTRNIGAKSVVKPAKSIK